MQDVPRHFLREVRRTGRTQFSPTTAPKPRRHTDPATILLVKQCDMKKYKLPRQSATTVAATTDLVILLVIKQSDTLKYKPTRQNATAVAATTSQADPG